MPLVSCEWTSNKNLEKHYPRYRVPNSNRPPSDCWVLCYKKGVNRLLRLRINIILGLRYLWLPINILLIISNKILYYLIFNQYYFENNPKKNHTPDVPRGLFTIYLQFGSASKPTIIIIRAKANRPLQKSICRSNMYFTDCPCFILFVVRHLGL